jgi:uncharacterized RDD family membrane protein YckC
VSAPQQETAFEPRDVADWKQEIAERLDAYRSKHPSDDIPSEARTQPHGRSRASNIARAVASRYAAAPSYSELLEQAALREQLAEQEARAAHARRMLEAADAGQQPLPLVTENCAEEAATNPADSPASAPAILGTPVLPQFSRPRESYARQAAAEPEPSLEDLLASTLVEPRAPLPSKLIEFPRELVSARRARPKDPEPPPVAGIPADLLPDPSQLRIFEVQPQAPGVQATVVEPAPAPDVNPADAAVALPEPAPAVTRAPSRKVVEEPAASFDAASQPAVRTFRNLEWASLSLDREPETSHRAKESSAPDYAPFLTDLASIDRRLMAVAVDFTAVTGAFLAFLLVFAACTTQLPTGTPALVLSAVVYGALWLIYQLLFFTLSGATAGMLYARIALCTFEDQNPTQRQIRARMAAWWLACLPLGLGFLWCFVDEDNLGWHDRMTRTYQREY